MNAWKLALGLLMFLTLAAAGFFVWLDFATERLNIFWFLSLIAPALVMFVAVQAKKWWGVLSGAVISFFLTYVLCLMAIIRKWDLKNENAITPEQMAMAIGDGGNKVFTLYFTGPLEGFFWTALWWFVFYFFYRNEKAHRIMEVNKKYALTACLLICVFGVLWPFQLSYLWLGETHIRYLMLRSTPIGTTWTNVESFLKRKRIKIEDSWKNTGYPFNSKPGKAIGHGVIYAPLGWCPGLPWRRHVHVGGYWIFDSNDHLIEIKIEKLFFRR